MKITHASSFGELAAPKRGEGGFITITFVVLLAIMMILVTAETRSVIHLRQETKLLEQQQVKRLNAPQTNAVAVILSEPK
jgi:hypothetical protein